VSEVVFVRTNYEYQSYSDLWRLVELAGFRQIRVHEFDLAQDYVGILPIVNGELRPHMTHRRSILKGPQWAKLIFLNLERPDSGDYEVSKITPTGVSNSTSEILEYVDHVWVSDRYWASLDPRLIYVPMGSDSRLAGGPPGPAAYDACTLTYNNHRRDQVYGVLKQQVRMAPSSAWGEERDRILRSSRCMVYVHQTPMPIGAPLRMALAAAYKLPVVSEQLGDAYPHRDGYDVLLAPYDQMIPRTLGALQGNLTELGENLYRKLCMEHPFRKCVEEGLERTLAS
jgi:hypothetical protein